MKRCLIITVWSVALALSAFAQNPPLLTTTLVLEATIPGTPAFSLVVLNQVAGRDFNDDGVPDVSFITKDSAHPKLEIVDGTDLETRWAFLPEIGDEVLLDFSRAHVIGFVALNPDDGLKAIILAERQGRRYVHPVILDAEGSLLWDGSGRVLLTIGDREADLTERIVVFNPQIPQVEVWGVENE